MCPDDEVHVVLLEETAHHIWPEDERYATIVLCPTCNILVWIGPEEIANQSRVRHVSRANQTTNLIEIVDLWRQPTMHAHDFFVDQTTDRHTIEHIAELLPHLNVVAPLALIIKPIDPGDGCTFVVSSQLEKVLWVFRLVRKHQRDGFETLLTAIDVVTEEDIVAIGWHSTILEEAQEIVVLAMHIAADFDGRFELKQRTLAQEDFAYGSA